MAIVHDEEVPLTGGNATAAVVRVGDTVRKPWSAATPSVARYMDHLRAQGIDVPEWRGRDDRGRQVLEHVPGGLAMDRGPLDEDGLRRVGQLVRRIHDASVGFTADTPDPGPETDTASARSTAADAAGWDVLIPPPTRADLVCHNDLAPWNLVLGDRWVFIDWDGAGPSTRLWDLAYAAQAFAALDPAQPVASAARRLRWFVDGYGAGDDLREALPAAMADRAAAMWSLLRDAAASGREPWGSMYASGHGAYWRAASDHITAHHDEWAAALHE